MLRIFATICCITLLAACSPGSLVEQLAPSAATNVPQSVPGSVARSAPTAVRPSGPLPTAASITQTSPVPTIEAALTNPIEQQQRLLVELYRRVSPSVVSIELIGTHPQVNGQAAPQGEIPISQGSGFLVDQQGHIVTNNHVVEGGQRFEVSFADGTTVPGSLVGTDPGSDLAILRVDHIPEGTAPLTLGESNNVAVGQTAVAIGNPFGLQNTLTIGVISGLGRALDGPQVQSGGSFSIPNIIQTDAAINPGNSGGPLLNIFGEVIGVNTAINSSTGGFEGVGYAVPSDTVTRVIPALIANGKYDHPWLGVSMQDVTALLAEQLGLKVTNGVLVMDVVANGPSAKAGLRGDPSSASARSFSGDIITAINGSAVRRSSDLRSYIEQNARVGDTITLTVLRNSSPQQVPIVLEARPE